MATNLPQIKAYVDESTKQKIRILGAYERKSISEKTGDILKEYILKYETEHGEIKLSDND